MSENILKNLDNENKYGNIPEEYVRRDIEILSERFSSANEEVIARYCTTSDKYRNCTFEMKNPSAQQLRIIQLFKHLLVGDTRLCYDAYLNKNSDERNLRTLPPIYSSAPTYQAELVPCPLRPKIGVYLHGPIGRGKTHIMAAYANELLKLLNGNAQREGVIAERDITTLVNSAAKQMISLSAGQKFAAENSQFESMVSQAEGFYKTGLQRISNNLRKDFSRKDLFFIDFDSFIEIYQHDASILQQAIEAPILIIDDIHLKGDINRARIIQDLLERRYNTGRKAIFINGNLSPEQLINPEGPEFKGFDQILIQRLISRCKEMFYVFNIEDTGDYREKIGKEIGASIDDLLNTADESVITEAKLASRNGNHIQASKLYEQVNNITEATKEAILAEDYSRVSELYERVEDFKNAGVFAEKANDFKRALEFFKQIHNPCASANIAKQLNETDNNVIDDTLDYFKKVNDKLAGEFAMYTGRHSEASVLLENANDLDNASKEAEKADEFERALELYKKTKNPSNWKINSLEELIAKAPKKVEK